MLNCLNLYTITNHLFISFPKNLFISFPKNLFIGLPLLSFAASAGTFIIDKKIFSKGND